MLDILPAARVILREPRRLKDLGSNVLARSKVNSRVSTGTGFRMQDIL